jgi:hypothetical protein
MCDAAVQCNIRSTVDIGIQCEVPANETDPDVSMISDSMPIDDMSTDNDSVCDDDYHSDSTQDEYAASDSDSSSENHDNIR